MFRARPAAPLEAGLQRFRTVREPGRINAYHRYTENNDLMGVHHTSQAMRSRELE